MCDKTDWNALAAREGERRREERPHYIGDVVARYRRLYGDDEDKAAIIIKIPDHNDLVIGPLRSAIAKEVFDSICQPVSVVPSDIKVGDHVRVRGDYNDCTDHLDSKIGVVIEERDEEFNDYLVRFDDDYGDCIVMRIWSYNILEVLKDYEEN